MVKKYERLVYSIPRSYGLSPADAADAWSGTSMAAPLVAGRAALIQSIQPPAGASCVSGIVETTADKAALDAANPDLVGRLGSGHADAAASTTYAANQPNPCSGTGDD
jgi:subtilisin family serine protease